MKSYNICPFLNYMASFTQPDCLRLVPTAVCINTPPLVCINTLSSVCISSPSSYVYQHPSSCVYQHPFSYVYHHPMDCSLPVSSVRGIFQAIILEWVSISFSRGSIFPTQGLNPPLLVLLHWQADSSPPGKPYLQLPQIHNVPWNCSALKTKQNKNKNKNSVFLCPRCYGQTSAPALRVRMCPAAGLMQLDWLISHNHIKSIYLLSIL